MSPALRLLNFLASRSGRAVWLICLCLVLALGAVDYATGAVVAFAFFYLLPISMASWALGLRAGRIIAVVSAAVLEAGQVVSGGETGVLLVAWNSAVRLGVFLVVANLVSEFRHLLRHETELSRTDPLTGVLNRRAFVEAGKLAIENMERGAGPLTLAFIDVDNFKAVNDASGHAAGDALLLRAAGCLTSKLWGTDAVARLGGDEFGILLPETESAAAQIVLPRLKNQLVSEMEHGQWPVTFSVGVVTCGAPPPSIEELIHMADQVMYSAKRSGKNRIAYATYPELLQVGDPAAASPERGRVRDLQ